MKAEGRRQKAEGTAGKGWFSLIPHPSSLILLAATVLVAACGFQLRGTAQMPFTSMYVQAATNSQFATQLKRVVRTGSGTRLVNRPEEAQVILHILDEAQEKKILSLTGGGRVGEFLLLYRVAFRLSDGKNREHIPAGEILLKRDYSYSDDRALSKDSEEALLYRDMRNDAVQQLVRRLQAAKIQS